MIDENKEDINHLKEVYNSLTNNSSDDNNHKKQ